MKSKLARRQAREIAVQTLYQMEMNEVTAEVALRAALEELTEEEDTVTVDPTDDVQFLHAIVNGASAKVEQIDRVLEDYLTGWKMDRLSKVDRQILRLGTYEMFFEEGTPDAVILNEAIELAKHFGTEESGKFVNGVLGQMVRERESIEPKLK
jgi:N utilization substance protein B